MIALIGWIATIATALYAFYSILTPGGKSYVNNLITNIYHGFITTAGPILADTEAQLLPLVNLFVQAFKNYGPGIAQAVRDPVAALVQGQFNLVEANLKTNGVSTVDNAEKMAADAIVAAYGFGLSSAVVTTAFEAVFPEKLNTLNGIGPMLAQAAGFSEVAKASLDPLYDAAFGVSLEHHYMKQFRPKHLDAGASRAAFRRRFITQAQFEELLALEGLAPQYVGNTEKLAFEPISARLLASTMDDGPFNPTGITKILQDNGYSDDDVTAMLNIMSYRSTKSIRMNIVTAAEANYIAGILDDAGFSRALDSVNIRAEAKAFIEQAALQKRLKVLTEDYKRGWDAEFLAGKVSHDDYRVALTGLGYTPPVIDAIVGGMSQKLDAHEFVGEQAEVRRERRQTQTLAIQTAMTAYHRNEIDAPALTAALLVAGLPGPTAALYVSLAAARGRIAQHAASTKRTPAQQLDIKAATEEYFKGVIDVNRFTFLLQQAGMSADDISDEIRYQNARGAAGQNLPPSQGPNLHHAQL